MVAIELVVYGVVYRDNSGQVVYRIIKLRPDATVGDYLLERDIYSDYLEEFKGTTATLLASELEELFATAS